MGIAIPVSSACRQRKNNLETSEVANVPDEEEKPKMKPKSVQFISKWSMFLMLAKQKVSL
jgi:hypothetical protein